MSSRAPGTARPGRLLLVGGGHAHIEVVRRLAGRRDIEATLINPGCYASYSGMLGGLLAGHYRFEDTHIDLQQLCERSGARLVLGCVQRLRASDGEADCEDGSRHSFDVVSVDTGSVPQAADVPGATTHAVAVKPVSTFLLTWERWLASRGSAVAGGRHVVVVGGGAAGIELILSMRQRLAESQAKAHSGARSALFTLISAGMLSGHAPPVQRRVRAVLQARGIQLARDTVLAVDQGLVRTASGRSFPADFVVFATQATAPPWLADSRLALDSRGFIAVDHYLRSLSHSNVFAAGDVATNPQRPAPKSGVYAVRAGPILTKNLLSALRGESPTARFTPPRRALSLIGSGDQHATLSYGPIGLSGRWVWHLKDFIDRRFVAKYAGGRPE